MGRGREHLCIGASDLSHRDLNFKSDDNQSLGREPMSLWHFPWDRELSTALAFCSTEKSSTGIDATRVEVAETRNSWADRSREHSVISP